MTSRLREIVLVPLATSPSLQSSVSMPHILHPPHIFFQKSQHDKIVYNDTLTFCIKKSILIEIKGFISVFLNFTNSLNCEEQLQGYNQDIKIKNLSAN